MTEIIMPLSTALAAAGIFGTFVFFPLMKIEQHIAKIESSVSKLAGIVENCPYCMRRNGDELNEKHKQQSHKHNSGYNG